MAYPYDEQEPRRITVRHQGDLAVLTVRDCHGFIAVHVLDKEAQSDLCDQLQQAGKYLSDTVRLNISESYGRHTRPQLLDIL